MSFILSSRYPGDSVHLEINGLTHVNGMLQDFTFNDTWDDPLTSNVRAIYL